MDDEYEEGYYDDAEDYDDDDWEYSDADLDEDFDEYWGDEDED